MDKQNLTPKECQALYLQALKKSGIEPFKTKTARVSSLGDFTDAIIKAYDEGETQDENN